MRSALGTILLITTLALTAGTANASSPAGVWSIPQLVQVLEEAGDRPILLLEGLFAVYTGDGEGPVEVPALHGYAPAEWGVMYYQCKAGEKEHCLQQWGELAAAAASDEPCRGWGNQEELPGTVRDYGAPSSPDDYRISGGVVTGFSTCEHLATIPEPVAEPAPEPGPEPVAEVPTPTEEPVVEPEPTAEPAVETSAATDTRPTPMPNDDVAAQDCSGAGPSGMLALLVSLMTLVQLRSAGRRTGARTSAQLRS